MECKAKSVKRKVWSVKCKVLRVERIMCRVWSVESKCSVKCRVRTAECRVMSVKCAAKWSVECKVWSLQRRL